MFFGAVRFLGFGFVGVLGGLFGVFLCFVVFFLWSVRGLGFGFVGVLGAFLVFFCVLLCSFVVCSVSWFWFLGLFWVVFLFVSGGK